MAEEQQQGQLDYDIIANQVRRDVPSNTNIDYDAIANQVRQGTAPVAPTATPTMPNAPTGPGAGAIQTVPFDLAAGALKGLMGTIQSGGNLIRRTTGLGGPSINLPISTEPTNTMQRIGQGVEQAAEYALPGMGVESATAKLPMLARAVAQAGTGATIAALQGKTPSEAGVAAGLSAATPVAGTLWPEAKAFVANKVTPRMLNALMEVNPKWLEFGQNPGGRIVQEGLTATTKDGLALKVADKATDAGKALELYLLRNGAGKTIDADPIVTNALVNAQKRIGMGSDDAFNKKLDIVLTDILQQAPNLNSLTPLQAQRLKSAIGDSVKWHGTPYEGDVNQALIEMYTGLNKATEAAVPGSKQMLSRYGDLKIAQNSLKDSINRDMTRGIGQMLKTIPTPAATVAGQLQQLLMNPTSNIPSTVLGRFGLGGLLSQQGQTPGQTNQ